jgi:purine-cytosine permease-like protein
MNIIMVGKKNGKRRIQWLNFFFLGTMLGMVIGLGGGGVYYLLCGRWSHAAVIQGIVVGVLLVSGCLASGLRTPVDKLRQLK